MNKYPSETIEQIGMIKEIVCKENGRIFHLTNNSNLFIQKIKVDNKLITSGIRCDYAIDTNNLENKLEAENIFLIELKGSDKSHACEQILKTYNYFLENYKAKIFSCRIILSKDNAPKILSTNQKKLLLLEKQHKIDLKIQSQKINEVI